MKITELFEDTYPDDMIEIGAQIPRKMGSLRRLVSKTGNEVLDKRLAAAREKEKVANSMATARAELKIAAKNHGVKVRVSAHEDHSIDLLISGRRHNVINFVREVVMVKDGTGGFGVSYEDAAKFVEAEEL